MEMVFFRGKEAMTSTTPTTIRSCARVDRGEGPVTLLESDFAVFEGTLTVFVTGVWGSPLFTRS